MGVRRITDWERVTLVRRSLAAFIATIFVRVADHSPKNRSGVTSATRAFIRQVSRCCSPGWCGKARVPTGHTCESAVSQRLSERTRDRDSRCGDVFPITDSETLETARTFPLWWRPTSEST